MTCIHIVRQGLPSSRILTLPWHLTLHFILLRLLWSQSHRYVNSGRTVTLGSLQHDNTHEVLYANGILAATKYKHVQTNLVPVI